MISSHHVNKAVEQVSGVLRSRAGFRMVLHGEDVLSDVFEAFVGSVVDIGECRYGNGRVQALRIHCVAVVLG